MSCWFRLGRWMCKCTLRNYKEIHNCDFGSGEGGIDRRVGKKIAAAYSLLLQSLRTTTKTSQSNVIHWSTLQAVQFLLKLKTIPSAVCKKKRERQITITSIRRTESLDAPAPRFSLTQSVMISRSKEGIKRHTFLIPFIFLVAPFWKSCSASMKHTMQCTCFHTISLWGLPDKWDR